MAFVIKLQFCEDFLPVLHHLSLKIPGFPSFYSAWQVQSEGFLHIDLKDLNQVYQFLTRSPCDDLELNLNFYVDHILEIAPSSTYKQKWWECELGGLLILSAKSPAFFTPNSAFFDLPSPLFQPPLSPSSQLSATSWIYQLH